MLSVSFAYTTFFSDSSLNLPSYSCHVVTASSSSSVITTVFPSVTTMYSTLISSILVTISTPASASTYCPYVIVLRSLSQIEASFTMIFPTSPSSYFFLTVIFATSEVTARLLILDNTSSFVLVTTQ